MARVPFSFDKTMRVRAPQGEVFDLLEDVDRSAKLMPGLTECYQLEDGNWYFLFAPLQIKGLGYKGSYVAEFTFEKPHRVAWVWQPDYEDVNIEIDAFWDIQKAGKSETNLRLCVDFGVHLPLPKFLVGLAGKLLELRAHRDLGNYFKHIKAELS